MELQYLSLLQGVLEYEQKSLKSTCVLFAVAIIIILLFVVIRFKKEKVANRIMMCGILILLCTVFGFYLASAYQDQLALQADMEEGSFVIYTGTFVHDEYPTDAFYHNITIDPADPSGNMLYYPDFGNLYQLYSDTEFMPVGTMSGTIVYGKNSHIVLDWDCDEEPLPEFP